MALSAVRSNVSPSESVKAYSLYIDGKWSEAADGAMADDFNPATGALFARVAQGGRADALRAVEAAYKARESWARMIVSEPLGDVLGVWNHVPEASWGVVQPGPDEISTFRPSPPVTA